MALPRSIARLAVLVYLAICTPLRLARLAFDALSYLVLPRTRPGKSWSLWQAVAVRGVRFGIYYVSMLRANKGGRLSLEPGKEGARFEVLGPAPAQVYVGPLRTACSSETAKSSSSSGSSSAPVVPGPVGLTWTPRRPSAAQARDATIVMHVHGGGFVLYTGRDEDSAPVAQALLRHVGADYVCAPQYRLAGEKGLGRFPAGLQDVVTVYRHLVREVGVPPAQMILSGDSAGGNLALGLLRYISEHGAAVGLGPPGAAMLWAPWTDVGAGLLRENVVGSANYLSDYIDAEFSLWGAGAVSGYGAIDAGGPYLSPLQHPFTMPEGQRVPMFVQGGEREALYNDIKAFARRYAEAGWDLHLHTSRGCPHDILFLGERIGFERETGEAAAAARQFLLALARE